MFDDIYYFAGEIREVNFAKGNFRFASSIYIKDVLSSINVMTEDIVKKYIEMNIVHSFRDENEYLG